MRASISFCVMFLCARSFNWNVSLQIIVQLTKKYQTKINVYVWLYINFKKNQHKLCAYQYVLACSNLKKIKRASISSCVIFFVRVHLFHFKLKFNLQKKIKPKWKCMPNVNPKFEISNKWCVHHYFLSCSNLKINNACINMFVRDDFLCAFIQTKLLFTSNYCST